MNSYIFKNSVNQIMTQSSFSKAKVSLLQMMISLVEYRIEHCKNLQECKSAHVQLYLYQFRHVKLKLALP